MRKKRKLSKESNTKAAIIFVAFVISIISISLIFKFIFLLSQSQFDDSKKFTIIVSNQKNIEVVSFSPDSAKTGPKSRSISILKLNENINTPVGQFLAISIDGFVKGDSLDLNQKIDSLLPKMILNYKKLQTNLSVIDFIKFFIFAKSLPDREIYIKDISQDLNNGEIDSIVTKLVSDVQIEKDAKTIQIINGTNVLGLGNRLARLVNNIGGDVIIVATANKTQKYSEISYIDNKSYTVERLSKILGFKVVEVSDEKIADIVITIGEDSLNSKTF